MPQARTRILRKDVVVEIRRFIFFWVEYALLSSRRNRLESEASDLVGELLEKLAEIRAAEQQLAVELAKAEENESKNYGKSKPFHISKSDLLDWVGHSKSDRRFDRSKQDWKKHVNPRTLADYGMRPELSSSPGSLRGKGAQLLDKAGPTGTTVYTREGLGKHAVHLANQMGADSIMDYKEEGKGKSGDTSGNSDKAIRKRIREQNPFEDSEFYSDNNRQGYEKWINREFQENKERYFDRT